METRSGWNALLVCTVKLYSAFRKYQRQELPEKFTCAILSARNKVSSVCRWINQDRLPGRNVKRMTQITLVVVDDHPLFRQGVTRFLSLDPDISVIGSAADGEGALKVIRELKPLIAIVDVNLPKLNGQRVTHHITTEKLPTRVILLTAYDDPEQLIHAFYSGAYAYCSKGVEPEKLLQVVHHVAKGKYVAGEQILSRSGLDRWMIKHTVGSSRSSGDLGESYEPLSEREMEVLSYVTKGMSNKDIGVILEISHQTVKNHVTSILRKLNVEDRTQAALFALQRGWVRLYKENNVNQE